MKILGIVVVLFVSLLVAGYVFRTRGEAVHWTEEAALQDGRTLNVQRAVRLTYGGGGDLSQLAHKWPHYYSLNFSHPGTGKSIEWKGEFGYNPVLIDFVSGVPYLVIMHSNVFANLKQYGCPEIPYVFFRFDINKEHWEQVSSSVFPAALSHANLKVDFYGGVNIEEGSRLTKEMVADNNFDEERVSGYFTSTIPKDFNSWTYKSKERAKKDRVQDGCRPAHEVIPIPPLGQQVNLDVIERKVYKPEWIIMDADDPASPWKALSWDKNRAEICKSLLRPEDPGVQGWNFFIKDPSEQKKMRETGPLICDIDNVWAIDYVVEKGRVVIAKYRSNGDLSYRASFAKPDEPGWYLGGIMQPTLKAENGYLYFEWWNLNNSGREVHIKRSMKVRIQEPVGNVAEPSTRATKLN
jgi:hypothetical protein